MDITGWITGQVFVHTVDEGEVQQIVEFLNAQGVPNQVMTTAEQMVLDSSQPSGAVTTTSFSIVAQYAGFPQVVAPVLSDFMQRAHGGGWELPTPEPESCGPQPALISSMPISSVVCSPPTKSSCGSAASAASSGNRVATSSFGA